MGNPYVLLWLEAPLQSWGYDSKFGRRFSLDFPTRSGVLGLVCCALGRGGAATAWLADWAHLDMSVLAFVRQAKNMGGITRQPLLEDFHMVGAGYCEEDEWQKLMAPKTEKGTKAVGGGAKMTYRYYVQDMAYAVALEVPEAVSDEVTQGLISPVWDLYLGRKCCVPTEFIFQGRYEDSVAAFRRADEIAAAKKRVTAFRVVQGEGEENGEALTLNDVPVSFGERKVYRDRRVTVIRANDTV